MLLAEPQRIDLAPLIRAEADDVLFPRTVQTELRQLFTLLGDRLAKHVGIDLRSYGVGRGDRLRAKDSKVAAHAQEVANGLGFGDIDVYVSTRQPYAMVAEPTSPVSLVLGQTIAQGDAAMIRFAAGAALKLAQASLAIPARLSETDLGVLTVALLRLVQTDFPQEGLEETAIATAGAKAAAADSDGPHERAQAVRARGRRAALPPRVARTRSARRRAACRARRGRLVARRPDHPRARRRHRRLARQSDGAGPISFALGEDHAALSR